MQKNNQFYFFKIYLIICVCILTLYLNGCATNSPIIQDGSPREDNIDVSKIANAVPKIEPLSKYGNPSSYVVDGHRYYVNSSSIGYNEKGIASWYGTKFASKRTSSGDPYDMYAMTAASKTLPIPTYVEVTNLENNKQVIVKVNDRGPFHENRIIDLSYAAAKKLGVFPGGTALVQVVAIDPSNYKQSTVQSNKHRQLYLQLGAFSQKKNAEQLSKKISQQINAPTHVQTIKLASNKILYCVKIGPIKNIQQSDKIHHQLLEKKLGTPITVITS